MRKYKTRRFETAYFIALLTTVVAFPAFPQSSSIIAPPSVAAPIALPIASQIVPQPSALPIVTDAKDAQDKSDALIKIFVDSMNGPQDVDTLNFPREEFTTALRNISAADREIVFKTLQKSISVQREPIILGRILFAQFFKDRQDNMLLTAEAFEKLFRTIVLTSNNLSEIVTSIMLSKAKFILRRSPDEQAIILLGLNDIPDVEQGVSRQRTSLLDKVDEKKMMSEKTSAINIIETLECFRLIPLAKLKAYYRFIEGYKHKIFPSDLKRDHYSKIFRLFYETQDYKNLVGSALNNTLVSPKVPLDQTIAILRAFNEVDPKQQDNFIKTLDEQMLLSKDMDPVHLAVVLSDLKNVPLPEIISIKKELITQKLIGTGWPGEDISPLIHAIHFAQDQKDAYARLIWIKKISSSKFQRSDFAKLNDKLKNVETNQLKNIVLSFLKDFKSIQEWSQNDTLIILRAMSMIPAGRSDVLATVQVKIAVSGNDDKNALTIANFIKEASMQPQANQQDLLNLLTPPFDATTVPQTVMSVPSMQQQSMMASPPQMTNTFVPPQSMPFQQSAPSMAPQQTMMAPQQLPNTFNNPQQQQSMFMPSVPQQQQPTQQSVYMPQMYPQQQQDPNYPYYGS